MDLGTIKNKLLLGDYAKPEELFEDVSLMCENAVKFNGNVSKGL
ncbi:unnamed protein product [Pylaiella littoralis]